MKIAGWTHSELSNIHKYYGSENCEKCPLILIGRKRIILPGNEIR